MIDASSRQGRPVPRKGKPCGADELLQRTPVRLGQLVPQHRVPVGGHPSMLTRGPALHGTVAQGYRERMNDILDVDLLAFEKGRPMRKFFDQYTLWTPTVGSKALTRDSRVMSKARSV